MAIGIGARRSDSPYSYRSQRVFPPSFAAPSMIAPGIPTRKLQERECRATYVPISPVVVLGEYVPTPAQQHREPCQQRPQLKRCQLCQTLLVSVTQVPILHVQAWHGECLQ